MYKKKNHDTKKVQTIEMSLCELHVFGFCHTLKLLHAARMSCLTKMSINAIKNYGIHLREMTQFSGAHATLSS